MASVGTLPAGAAVAQLGRLALLLPILPAQKSLRLYSILYSAPYCTRSVQKRGRLYKLTPWALSYDKGRK